MLAETKGHIPNNFIKALRDIKQRDVVISEKDEVIKDREAKLLEKDA